MGGERAAGVLRRLAVLALVALGVVGVGGCEGTGRPRGAYVGGAGGVNVAR